jgi:hypothetical protein
MHEPQKAPPEAHPHMRIRIETIVHDKQRYETVGDYWDDPDGTQHIRVSDMRNQQYEMLVAIHELIEKELCRIRGIPEEIITKFDIQYEEERIQGYHGATDEPGDDSRAPYQKEHQFATRIEMEIAKEMGVDWKAYEQAVLDLPLRVK